MNDYMTKPVSLKATHFTYLKTSNNSAVQYPAKKKLMLA
jgi:hypothetical protein